MSSAVIEISPSTQRRPLINTVELEMSKLNEVPLTKEKSLVSPISTGPKKDAGTEHDRDSQGSHSTGSRGSQASTLHTRFGMFQKSRASSEVCAFYFLSEIVTVLY